jgi:hypothetical protein
MRSQNVIFALQFVTYVALTAHGRKCLTEWNSELGCRRIITSQARSNIYLPTIQAQYVVGTKQRRRPWPFFPPHIYSSGLAKSQISCATSKLNEGRQCAPVKLQAAIRTVREMMDNILDPAAANYTIETKACLMFTWKARVLSENSTTLCGNIL